MEILLRLPAENGGERRVRVFSSVEEVKREKVGGMELYFRGQTNSGMLKLSEEEFEKLANKIYVKLVKSSVSKGRKSSAGSRGRKKSSKKGRSK
ncbi:hypothetical protein D6817_04510 [Candidatus Pacearchaeota archaeon]|nr:MAG: hypothetical protein D6817_04510 [Candidatus Pacearchaeota archaeon]